MNFNSYNQHIFKNFENQKKERLNNKTKLSILLEFLLDDEIFLSFKNIKGEIKQFQKEKLSKFCKKFEPKKIYQIKYNPSNNWEILDFKKTNYKDFNQIKEIKENKRRFRK